MCGECLAQELGPLRQKLAHGRALMPQLQERCALTFAKSERKGRVRRECVEVAADCERLEKALEETARRLASSRLEVAKARRLNAERQGRLERAQGTLAARKAEVDALRRIVSRATTTTTTTTTRGPPKERDQGGGRDFSPRRSKDAKTWRRAEEIFELFPIKRTTPGPRSRASLRGVMTIVGLPLPNVGSGYVLADALPKEVCASALAAVALLTSVVANVFGVTLPHPLVPRVGTDTAAAVCGEGGRRHSFDGPSPQGQGLQRRQPRSAGAASSPSGAVSSPGGGALHHGAPSVKRPTSWGASKQYFATPKRSTTATPPGGGSGTWSSSSSTQQRYALAPRDGGDSDNFVIALNLLQNDVTYLCVKAGLDPSDLWPAEAILLNLAELRDTAARKVLDADAAEDDDAANTTTIDDDDDHDDHPAGAARGGEEDDAEEAEEDGRHPATASENDDAASSVADENDDWIFLGSLPFLGLSSDDERPPLQQGLSR